MARKAKCRMRDTGCDVSQIKTKKQAIAAFDRFLDKLAREYLAKLKKRQKH